MAPASAGASGGSTRGAGPDRGRGPAAWWRKVTGPDAPIEGDRTTLTYYSLLISTLVLLTFGLTMVFSVQSVSIAAEDGNPLTSFARYLGYALLGLVGMAVVARMPIRLIKLSAWPVFLAACAAQVLVYVPGLGDCVGGNCNWVRIPGAGTIQPSEFIKLGLCLLLGVVVSTRQDAFIDGVTTWRKAGRLAGWVLLPSVVAVGLVLGGHDLGTVIVLVMLVSGALWMGGLGWRWFAATAPLGLAAFALLTALSANRRARIVAWWNPEAADPLDAGYQPTHGRWALGTGGWWGVGPGESRQKWGYLTQADSDYIFAVLGEEFGLVGTLLVIGLFAIVGWCCLRIIRRSTSLYVSITAGGLMSWIVGQALVNMSVVVGLLPVLGVPLPLISAGGSALVSVLLAMGVLLAFARNEPGAAEALRSRAGAVRRTLAVIAPRRRNRA